MTVNLPPRRELPADIKERMRPDFAEPPHRNHNHIPFAVAAGVALLVAGGVAVTQSITDHDADPARGRLVSPSRLDLDRCRAALADQDWHSNEMVVFKGRKVLIGDDARFCELTRTRAFVAAKSAAPVQLEAGTITYRSDKIIAGTPPLGALKARARETNGTYSRGSNDAVTTPDFFVAYLPTPIIVSELIFDDRTVPVSPDATLPIASGSASFESGNGDPTTTDNRLARCLEVSAPASLRALEPGWHPITSAGFGGDARGLIVARQDHAPGQYGVCHASSDDSGFFTTHEVTDRPIEVASLGLSVGAERQLIAGRTRQEARTIELSGGLQSVTATVVDGFFAADISSMVMTSLSPSNDRLPLTAIVRGQDNSVLHTGEAK